MSEPSYEELKARLSQLEKEVEVKKRQCLGRSETSGPLCKVANISEQNSSIDLTPFQREVTSQLRLKYAINIKGVRAEIILKRMVASFHALGH